MKIAVIDKKDITLHIQNDTIKVDTQTIPLHLIDLLILNHRINLQTSDLLKMTKNDVALLVVSHDNKNISILHSANPKNAALKLAQYRSLKNRLNFAKYFLSQKIITHQKQLLSFGVELNISEAIMQLNTATTIETLLGIEGSFAREYFEHYFLQIPKRYHKQKRSKQPPLDPVNALLSYWYSLYYHIISVELLSYGFEPSIGYLHSAYRSHNALASDVLEIFRSSINQAVAGVFLNDTLKMEDFSKKGGVYLKYSGRKKVWSEFVALVQVLKPELMKTIATLRRMIDETASDS